jgi:hypothetical protein
MTNGLPYNESTLQMELSELKGTNVYLWLQEQLRVNSRTLTILKDDTQFRWLQGQAQQLDSLLSSIDAAAENAWVARDTSKRHEELKKLRNNRF